MSKGSVRAVRLARILWLTWALLTWNVVFDHVIVVAGRDYIVAAIAAAHSPAVPPRYANMDEWMRPAVTRGLWMASLSAGAILAAGFLLLGVAARPSAEPVTTCA
jgi:hypothetical protein